MNINNIHESNHELKNKNVYKKVKATYTYILFTEIKSPDLKLQSLARKS